MARPGAGGDKERSDAKVEGPLENAAAVLREPVDLAHSLLDEAELGTEEVPPALAEDAEIDRSASAAEEAGEAESLLGAAAKDQDGGVMDPEELEARLETESEAAELLSLHGEEPLTEVLLDEGAPLGTLEADAVEDELERLSETDEGRGRTRALGRPARRAVASPAGAGRAVAPGGLDRRRFARLLQAERARLEGLRAEFEREGLRQRPEREDLSQLSAVDQHPADEGTETFDRERDLSIREQVEGELAEVARALRRLDDGTYGRCEACGAPIGTSRLLAEPAARLCLADQRALEEELAVKHREVEL